MLPKRFLAAVNGTNPLLGGPNLVLIRFKQNAPPQAALASLRNIARTVNRALASLPGGSGNNAIVVQGVQRPAEIVNYRTMGLTPTLLVSGLALGAVVALALTLIASVRQRRRDLALLKTIGFVRGQLAAAVAWQASVVALIGILIGIPLGIVAGRWLWNLFARQINAVPYPTVSLSSMALVAAGTIVMANVVAAVPALGRRTNPDRAPAPGRVAPGGPSCSLARPSGPGGLFALCDFALCDGSLEVQQCLVQLGRAMSPGSVGRGELITGRELAARPHEVVRLDREREATEAFGAPRAQAPAHVVGRGCGRSLQTRNRLVHLHRRRESAALGRRSRFARARGRVRARLP